MVKTNTTEHLEMHPSTRTVPMPNQDPAKADHDYSHLRWRIDSIRYFGLDLHDDSEQIFDNLVSSFGPCLFYLCKLGVGIFAGVFFGFLVTAGMLHGMMSA